MFHENNDWVYGYLKIGDIAGKRTAFIIPADFDKCKIKEAPVYERTVGQYTGLTDKNGVKIFEGDIVMTGVRYDKLYSKSRKGQRLIGKVEHHIGEGERFYNDDTGKYDAHKMYSSEWKVAIPNIESKRKYCCYTWGDFFDCEVIGNIYDNPELMEVQDERNQE